MSEQHCWVGNLAKADEIFGPVYMISMGTTPFPPTPLAGPRATDLPPEFRKALREWLDTADVGEQGSQR